MRIDFDRAPPCSSHLTPEVNMNIFKKRPLSLILCIMLGGFSLFIDTTASVRLAMIGVSVIVFALSLKFKDLLKGRNVIVAVSAICFAVSVLLSHLFSTVYIPTALFDKNATVQGEVEKISHDSVHSVTLTLKSDLINGAVANHTFLIRASGEDFAEIGPGDEISVDGLIVDFDDESTAFDTEAYYISLGYNGQIVDISNVSLISPADSFKPDLLSSLRSYITSRLKLSTNGEVGGFLSALIMGDKSALGGGVSLNYRIIGISHILALSGMHLVILSDGIRAILSRFKLNKKIILLASTLFCLFYMAITGFSASVVRSAVMLTITNGLFLLTGSNDSYTTLPLSVFLIIAVQPYAVYDVSLWLSAFATLGIILYSDITSKSAKKAHNIPVSMLLWILKSILATIFAVGASYIILIGFCDSMSALAPITTLIFSAPITALIYAGVIVIIFGKAIPIGQIVVWFTDAINEIAEWFASISWASYSLDYIAVRILIVSLICTLITFAILEIKHRWTYVSVIIALFFSISIVGVTLTQLDRHSDTFEYTTDKYADVALIKEGGSVTCIYNGTHSAWATASITNLAAESRLTSIDNIVLTGYRAGTPSYIKSLAGKIKITTLYLPTCRTADEIAIAEALADMLSTYGTKIRFYEAEEPLLFGNYRLHILFSEQFKMGDTTDCAYTVNFDEEYYTYLSSGMPEHHTALSRMLAHSADYMIFGTHGGLKSKEGSFNSTSSRLKGIYYSSVHPMSESTVDFYKRKAVPINDIGTAIDLRR